jgi:hypothetical protein
MSRKQVGRRVKEKMQCNETENAFMFIAVVCVTTLTLLAVLLVQAPPARRRPPLPSVRDGR